MGLRAAFESLDWGPAPESTQIVEEFLQDFGPDHGLFIDGRWMEAPDAERFDTINPATGERLATLTQSGQDEIDAAVAAAGRAQPLWAALSGHQRARHLYALARMVQKHSRLFAILETLDNGKPIRESRDVDIPLVARHLHHHAGWAQLLDEVLPDHSPVGVCGAVIPWNFPLLMLAWKVAPALAAGNTVVLKPAEYTSLSALAFAELSRAAGLPPGVLNIITGDGRTGAALVAHEGIDKVAFTGSTEVGRSIRRALAGSDKGLSLELGGKSPYIVFEDADIDSAVEGLVDAIWFNQGQVCCAGSRLLVQESIAERFHEKLKARMSRLRIGNPLDKAVDMGAIVDEVQLDTITSLCQEAVDQGHDMWQPETSLPEEGLFFPPTLFCDVAPSAKIAQEEIFGPVLVSLTFRSPAEAISLANNTRYGLAGSVWSQDIDTALEVARSIRAGTIWVNCTNLFDANSGFGGYRESGFGREGGIEGLWAYLKPRRVDHVPPSVDSAPEKASNDAASVPDDQVQSIDRTTKLFIGGRQRRPDGGYSLPINGPDGFVAEVGRGNRKDVRDAVEAATKTSGWADINAHARSQVMYYIAENLQTRRDEFAARITAQTGADEQAAAGEVDASIAEWFRWAAWCDKHDGRVHETTLHGLVLALNEPLGVVGLVCPDDSPLHSFTRLLAPLMAMGNSVVVIPSQAHPLAAIEMYQVFETSDLPAGAVNIVSGLRDELLPTLGEHDGVDAIWASGIEMDEIHAASCGNMKQTWQASVYAEDAEMLRRATHVKNIWLPHRI